MEVKVVFFLEFVEFHTGKHGRARQEFICQHLPAVGDEVGVLDTGGNPIVVQRRYWDLPGGPAEIWLVGRDGQIELDEYEISTLRRLGWIISI